MTSYQGVLGREVLAGTEAVDGLFSLLPGGRRWSNAYKKTLAGITKYTSKLGIKKDANDLPEGGVFGVNHQDLDRTYQIGISDMLDGENGSERARDYLARKKDWMQRTLRYTRDPEGETYLKARLNTVDSLLDGLDSSKVKKNRWATLVHELTHSKWLDYFKNIRLGQYLNEGLTTWVEERLTGNKRDPRELYSHLRDRAVQIGGSFYGTLRELKEYDSYLESQKRQGVLSPDARAVVDMQPAIAA
ncbi:MAG: hypothetical protein JW716_04855 [Candidatus Aenigmarchaeota archaeon]|nr:hypothetical protein [Candidatus Aenigmarchaeota archaeon]